MDGFGMIRMFANSSEEMSQLEMECGLREPSIKVF